MSLNKSNKRCTKPILCKLFPLPPEGRYHNLAIDDESISYITTPHNSEKITNIIDSHLDYSIDRSDIQIFDAMAGVGGNTISFGKRFGSVVATEIDTTRYDMLRNNLIVYGLYNVIPINCNCVNIMTKLNCIDVLYLDPPWGGENYKQSNKLRFRIEDVYIDDIINILFDKKVTKSNILIIALKLPFNYDIELLFNKTKNNNIRMVMYKLEKMLIVIFQQRCF